MKTKIQVEQVSLLEETEDAFLVARAVHSLDQFLEEDIPGEHTLVLGGTRIKITIPENASYVS